MLSIVEAFPAFFSRIKIFDVSLPRPARHAREAGINVNSGNSVANVLLTRRGT